MAPSRRLVATHKLVAIEGIADIRRSLLPVGATRQAVIAGIEIPQCSSLLPHRGVLSFGAAAQARGSVASRPDLERFRSAPRTSRLCRGSLRVPHRLLSWEV